MAAAIIAMADSLGLRTVAEGVETDGQLRLLRSLGCDEMQGFLFSPPVPADEFAALFAARRGLTLPASADAPSLGTRFSGSQHAAAASPTVAAR
jgi:predicted signal transduction protein with EAL and GGDEF domain